MADTDQPEENGEPSDKKNNSSPWNPDQSLGGMTLEAIIDITGEFEHLNELVTRHIEKSGGLKDTDDYFTIVTPILDLLEVEIRVRSVHILTKKQMKLIIQDWIDKEIAEIK
jgi:hypothetical protein